MALNFPSSPTLNEIYTDSTSGFSYKWNGNSWISFSPSNVSNIKNIDDISSSFNGSTTTFALTSSSSSVSPTTSQQLIVSLGGIVQNPGQDYYVSGSDIVFTTAPQAGLTFFGIYLGTALTLTTVSDGVVSPSSLTAGGPQWDSSGNLTATKFYGDGSGLGNVSGVGLGTALTVNTNTATDNIYYTDEILHVNSTVTVNSPSLTAYTQYGDLAVNEGADFIIDDNTDFFADAIGLGTVGTFRELHGAGGRIRADVFTNKAGTGAPSFPNGISVTGTLSANNFIGNLTGDVTGNITGNINSSGISTFSSGIIISSGISTFSDGIVVSSGSTNTPSISPSGDSNTGIFFPSPDTIAFSEGGTEVIRLDSSTNVGIGTINPIAKLDIVGGDTRFNGVTETVATATTYNSGGSLVLELDLRNATTYTYNIPDNTQDIGIVSFKNVPAYTNNPSISSVTVLLKQSSVGLANSILGIGNTCTIVGYAGSPVSGISTRALVGSGLTAITLTPSADVVDFVSFFIHYNGETNTSVNSYKVYVSKNPSFR